jgi:multidrug efflux system membrane fusion protein
MRAARRESAAQGAARGQAPRAVAVVASAAKKGDLGVRLTGLGTVTALNTVTVRTRVDGQLMNFGVREGQLVRKGDALAQIDPRPFQVQLAQAEGQLAKDEATLKDARIDLQRFQVLITKDAIPRQQLDAQQATVDQLVGSLKSDQSQIDSAKLNLTYCRITAPIAGRVGLRLVDPGNIVHAADQNGLIVITQLQPITVIFTIPEDSLPMVLQQVRSGRRLDVDAYNRDLNTRLANGSLLTVDNQIDPTTGTVKLKAIFPNDDNALFPNQFVNARVLVDTIRGAVIVPTASIQRSPQSTFVYVVKPDHTVDMRNVQVRLSDGDDTAMLSGVAPGELVVIEGVDKLQPGMTVSIGRADAAGAKVANQ